MLIRKNPQSLIPWIQSTDILAFDTETTGLNVRKEKVIGFSLSDGQKSHYVIHLEWDGTKLIEIVPLAECMQVLKELQGKKLIVANGSFDGRIVFQYFGVNLIPSFYADVLLMAHMCNENLRSYALKSLGTMYLGQDASAEQAELKQHLKDKGAGAKEYYKADSTILGKYAEKDAALTYKLYEYFLPQIKADNLESFFFTEETMPLYKEVTIPMEMHGVALDMPLLLKTKSEIENEISEVEYKIQSELGPILGEFEDWFYDDNFKPSASGKFAQKVIVKYNLPAKLTPGGKYSTAGLDMKNRIAAMSKEEIRDIQKDMALDEGLKYVLNLQSPSQLCKIFFSILKEKPISFTEQGAPQVNEGFLLSMKDKYSWVDTLLTYNRLTKLHGTYMVRFVDEQEDGIFYPSFLQNRTVSGRYGSDFQQLPRPIEKDDLDFNRPETKYTNIIRQFFISRPKKIIVDADFTSLEPHCFGHASTDSRLQDIFNKGMDFYSTIAIGAENLEGYSADPTAENYLGKKGKSIRQKAKSYCLGIPYGMTPYKLHKDLKISEAEAQRIHRGYFQAFPDLKKWYDESIKEACLNGQVRTEYGRIRRFPTLKESFAKYGNILFDSLELWKQYHDIPGEYKEMKRLARECTNERNNGINFKIQGLAASITNRACIQIARRLKGLDAIIIAQVHDEIVVESEESISSEVSKIVQEEMESFKLTVKLKAPPSYGYNLKDAK